MIGARLQALFIGCDFFPRKFLSTCTLFMMPSLLLHLFLTKQCKRSTGINAAGFSTPSLGCCQCTPLAFRWAIKLAGNPAVCESLPHCLYLIIRGSIENPGSNFTELEDGRPFFICDYVEGIPINVYCERERPSTTEKLELLRGLGAALQHAHTNLVLHLDIKPQNVLVQSDGTPMLLDFGVARLIGENTAQHHAFSPGYASPEQIRGELLSAASDVYSLGALMYFLLAGEPPFSVPSQSPSETILAQRTEFVERLDRADGFKGIDTDLRAIVQKAMTENPSERYATVEALLRDLSYYRQGFPVAARPKTYAYRFSKYLCRHPLALGMVAVSFVALAAFGLREADLRRQAEAALLFKRMRQ